MEDKSAYWLQDAAGRVLGPVGIAVLRDLVAAGRLQDVALVSRDGKSWSPASKVPEVFQLFSQKTRREDERAEAARLRGLIHDLHDKPPHEVFGLAVDDTLESFRLAFFDLVKRYHPERLPSDSDPDLAAANDEMFHFLARAFTRVELLKQLERPKKTADAPASAPAAAAPPSFGPGEFVGLSRGPDGLVKANIRVTVANAGQMFADHQVMNLSRGSIFLTGLKPPPPLGSLLDLTFHFPGRELRCRGKVVWESIGVGKAPPGLGVKLMTLTDEGVAWIQTFLESLQKPKR